MVARGTQALRLCRARSVREHLPSRLSEFSAVRACIQSLLCWVLPVGARGPRKATLREACPNNGYTSPGNMSSSSSSFILAALRGISRWCAATNPNTVMMDNSTIGLPSDHWDMGALEGNILELISQAMYEVEVAASIAGGNSKCSWEQYVRLTVNNAVL